MELLQTNKFAHLHDGEKIFFSHIGAVTSAFRDIEKLNQNVILITGNDDIPVGKYTGNHNADYYKKINKVFDNIPKNIKYWFAANNITRGSNIIPIPLGLKNCVPAKDQYVYDFAVPEHEILKNVYANHTSKPNNFLYLNYCNRPDHRNTAARICEKYLNIKYEESSLKYNDYIANILNSESVLCPIGVGVDTFRLYEVLYCKRIPITIKVGKIGVKYCDNDLPSWCGTLNAPPQQDEYPLYTDIYSKLPIVMLDNLEELKDMNHLKKLVDEQKNKEWDRNLLDFNYWKNLIYEYKNSLI